MQAIDAGKLRRFKRIRLKAVRLTIVTLAVVLAVLVYQRYDARRTWSAFELAARSFTDHFSAGEFAQAYVNLAHSGLMKAQTQDQFVRTLSHVYQATGPIGEILFAEYRGPTPQKPYHILIFMVQFQKGDRGLLHLAYGLEGGAWKIYAWKLSAIRDVPKK